MSKKPAPEVWEPSATGSEGTNHRYVVSPDGRIRIDYEAWELRKSEFLEAPSVTDLESGELLFSLPPYFDASEHWSGDHDFTFSVREGTNFTSIDVAVDVDSATLTIVRTGATHPFVRAERAIRKALEDYRASLPPPSPAPPPAPPPHPAVDIRKLAFGLLIALAFVVLVALGSYLWHENQPPEPPPYPPPPPMKEAEY